MLERAEDFRQRALDFAAAALPFVHRRLAPVKYPVKVLPTVERVPDGWQETQALKMDSKISR
jgi:hypothetical protein